MKKIGSLSIASTYTRNCTHFLKFGFVIAGGGFFSYYIHQGNKSEKENQIVRKKLSFMQFRVGAIPRLPKKSLFLVSTVVMK